MDILRKKFLLRVLLLVTLFLASCGPTIVSPRQSTAAPLTLPATWTPTPGPTGIATFTEIPTFTPVPVITLAYPTNDSLGALHERFQDSLFSPNGRWVAYRDPTKLRVVSNETTRVWTLPCELFDECSTVVPVKWSRNSQVLYFAPAPTVGGAPSGISLVTALAMIDVRSGKWSLLLPDSDRHYDFTFSSGDDYIAYTQSSGSLADKPSVTLGIFRIKNKKVQQELALDEVYGGNIVWSPYKSRIVFQVQNPEGSSVVFYDLDVNVLRYVVTEEQSDLGLSTWDENNLVMLEKKDWLTHLRSYWLLNPFSGEQTSASITATPDE